MTAPDLSAPGRSVLAAASRTARLDRALLVMMLAPLVVSTGVALARRWSPMGDAGYFTARSLDAFGPHHPFVGAFSSYSWNAPEWVNNLGPIQLLGLAPFTKVAPAAGTAVGTAAMNALAIVAVWAVAISRFGRAGRFGVALATVLIMSTFGGLAFVDPRQQVALLLPFWAFLWLTVLVADGVLWAGVAWITAGSFVLQTHLSYTYLVLALLFVGIVGFVLSWRGRVTPRRFAATAAVTVALVGVLWSHTIWDQIAGTGNLARVLSSSTEQPRGFTSALAVLGNGPFGRLSFLPGGVDRFAAAFDDPTALAWPAVIGWTAAATLAVAACVRRRDARSLRVVAVGAIVLVAAGVTVYRLPTTPYPGTPTENYLWMWPAALGALLTIASPLRFVAASAPRWCTRRAPRLAALAAVAALVTVNPVHMGVPDFRYSRIRSEAVGPRWYGELSSSLDRLDLEGPVLVSSIRRGQWVVEYAPLIALSEHGVDVRFPAGSPDLARFGAARCESGDERWRVEIGAVPASGPLDDRSVVLADGGNLDDAAIDDVTSLRARMATSIETAATRFRRDALDELGVTRSVVLNDLRHPEQAGRATAAMFWLSTLYASNGLVMTDDARAAYWAWIVAELEVAMDNVSVVLTPNEPTGSADCDA